MNDLVRVYNPVNMVLMETRVSGAQVAVVMNWIGFDKVLRMDAIGFSGGIWLFWRSERVEIELLSTTRQCMDVLVKQNTMIPWLFTAVYASPNIACRDALWDYILDVSRMHNFPWLIGGDLNEIASVEEKRGSVIAGKRLCALFS